MASRFKFRVWDDLLKRYFTLKELSSACAVDFVDGFILNDLDNRYVVEQYTGIDDSDGRPIYEGDIVRCQYGAAYRDGCVVWDRTEAGYYIVVDGDIYSFAKRHAEDTIKVIGNIRCVK